MLEPKDPSQRRRNNTPQRGEWVDITTERLEVKDYVLPAGRKGWTEEMLEVWREWRADPVTVYFTPADVQYALDSIQLYRNFEKHAPEIRRRAETMGLTPEGKRKLRFRIKPTMEVGHTATKEPNLAVVKLDDRRKALAHAG